MDGPVRQSAAVAERSFDDCWDLSVHRIIGNSNEKTSVPQSFPSNAEIDCKLIF